MAFSSAVTGYGQMGRMKMRTGTWNAASVTTGDIVTGLKSIKAFMAIGTSTTVVQDDGAATEMGSRKITCGSGDTGFWTAFGS